MRSSDNCHCAPCVSAQSCMDVVHALAVTRAVANLAGPWQRKLYNESGTYVDAQIHKTEAACQLLLSAVVGSSG